MKTSNKYAHQSPVKFLFLILISFSTIFGQGIENSLNKYLESYKNSKDVPSISAGASVDGKIIWTSTLGYANLENSVTATNKTVYRIASVSKPITAVAIMQLVEKGKIRLDEDIRSYVPYFPKKKWVVTVRNILTHTSGIRTYRPGEFDSKNYYASIKDAILVFADDTLETQPGTKYNYNTIAYNLLAAAIENASNMSFGDYLKKYIFEPADMKNSNLEFQRDLVPNRASGYIRTEENIIINAPLADLSFKYAGGGIISTVEDLLNFGNAILSNKLISRTTLENMLKPTILFSGEKISYGLGFGFSTDTLNRRCFLHEGGGTGFSSQLMIYPQLNSVFVHLINIRDKNLDNPALEISNIVFSKENHEKMLNTAIHKLSKK